MKNKERIISGNIRCTSTNLLAFIILFTAFPVIAAEAGELQKPRTLRSYTILGIPLLSADDNLVMGLEGGFSTNPYKGVDNEIVPTPEITCQNGNFTIDFSGISYTVFSPG
jgi:outer membrane scaffolding protein for murein synthesis (MipA/OmpV family)